MESRPVWKLIARKKTKKRKVPVWPLFQFDSSVLMLCLSRPFCKAEKDYLNGIFCFRETFLFHEADIRSDKPNTAWLPSKSRMVMTVAEGWTVWDSNLRQPPATFEHSCRWWVHRRLISRRAWLDLTRACVKGPSHQELKLGSRPMMLIWDFSDE